jgi:hypothetical protein
MTPALIIFIATGVVCLVGSAAMALHGVQELEEENERHV